MARRKWSQEYLNERYAYVKPLSTEQTNIISGAMLGDGACNIFDNGINAYFRYSSSHKDHVEFVFNYFKEYCNYDIVKSLINFNKKYNNSHIVYYFNTRSLPIFTEIRNKWYPEGIKIIPQDLKLNNLINLVWYIGDGSLENGKTQYSRSNRIILCTDCFLLTDLENIILPQLQKYSPRLTYCGLNKSGSPKYRITIPRIGVLPFLNDIGPCPVDSYIYKWNSPIYKTKAWETKITFITSDELVEFIKLYNDGYTCREIGTKFNYDRKRIEHQLKSAGIFVAGRDTVKLPVSNEQLDEIYKLREDKIPWKEIEKIYNITCSQILNYWNRHKIDIPK